MEEYNREGMEQIESDIESIKGNVSEIWVRYDRDDWVQAGRAPKQCLSGRQDRKGLEGKCGRKGILPKRAGKERRALSDL